MMPRNGLKTASSAGVVLGCLLVMSSAVWAAAPEKYGNGMRVTIHETDEVNGRILIEADGSRVFVHPLAGSVRLADVTRTMYPFDPAVVARALEDMSGFTTEIDIDVFILDSIPVETGGSFARRGAIFLSPSYAPVDAAIVSYITTHEVGHVLTWAFLDGRPGRWDAYAALRGIDLAAAGPQAPHARRAREIVAEDMRYLFGGSLATKDIGLENHQLILPDEVTGLREMLAEFVSGPREISAAATTHAFPNPCNPRTTIELVLPDGAADAEVATVAVFDIRGQRVRKLRGGASANGRIALTWDGADNEGRMVPSGRYFYTITAGGVEGRGSVSLVR